MKEVLFLCTHNSARSQMAEGLLRALGNGKFKPYSAGMEETKVRPEAIKVMAEIGIDISTQTSKTIGGYINRSFDDVITVCDSANAICPFFPNAKHRRHWSFPDPSVAKGGEDERLQVFRDSRDAIKTRIEKELLV